MHTTQPTGTVVVTNNAKRFACDRCRDLKLRCPRDLEDVPCDRCLRADARCVTSSGRPLGRPPAQNDSHVNVAVYQAPHHPQYKRQRVSGEPSAVATARARKTVGASGASTIPHHSLPKPMHTPYPHHPSLSTDTGPSQFENMLDMPYDLLEPSTGNGFPITESGYAPPFFESPQLCPAASDSLDTTYPDDHDPSHTQNIPNADEFCHFNISAPDLHPDIYSEPHGSNRAPPTATLMNTNSRIGTDTGWTTTGRPTSDWTTPLINALGSISRQLAELRMEACDLSSEPVGACTFEGITPNLEFLDTPLCDGASDASLRTKLLGKAVIATMRFILVLQMMAPSPVDWTGFVGEDDSSTAAEDAASRSSPPSPAPQVTLIILSTYLELGELFDIILSPTVQFLANLANVTLDSGERAEQSSSGARVMEPRSPRGAQGVARPRSQDILMTIRVVEHQLHTLERLIGLPAQYCLVGRKDVSTNVMYRHDASVLAKAVMRQALQTLLSLKKTLDCIQTAVRR
ncbi:hypothetical protein ASPCADRAFT_505887 [Aspergillus carbonarius ITEM 5010]|uniref:Zn(2)-C6 fungal-type domain-containing protein n=1 Tax=Aspergillus carbonarius (strain ITEM 5010) TaxID=602072 RepID=A0A1R3RSX6_ASPC5|nr:hypothetical protein ASPCADRAFT_505887 [Aspergillus carbonarius ITEM 5010]